jgi:hypothetical protein
MPKTHGFLCEIGLTREEDDAAIEKTISHCTAADDPSDPPARRAHFLALHAIERWVQKRPDDAFADANAALALNGNDVTARAQRAQVYLSRAELDHAEEDCARLLAALRLQLVRTRRA